MSDGLPNAVSFGDLISLTSEQLQDRLAAADPEEKARWVYAAAMSGSKAAMVQWGQILLDGEGAERDPAGAYRWFKIAADLGHADAINMLGRCHELGWGVPKDVATAVGWYRIAAAQGHEWAQFNWACLLLDGATAPPDPRAALTLFVRSARKGNAKAMNMLGRYREEGWASAIKLGAAYRWYCRAADRGCFRGQFHRARFLAARGMIDEAASWLRRSVMHATPDFCRDVGGLIFPHSDERLSDIGLLALRRACASSAPDDLANFGRALAQRRPDHMDEAVLCLAHAAYMGKHDAMADIHSLVPKSASRMRLLLRAAIRISKSELDPSQSLSRPRHKLSRIIPPRLRRRGHTMLRRAGIFLHLLRTAFLVR